MRITGVRTTVFAAAGAFIGAVAGQALLAGPAFAQGQGQGQGQAPEQSLAPQFQVDPDWPKQLPNNWQIGQAAGISVGPEGNIWVLHRPRTLDDSEAGATDAEPGIFVCNAGGDPVGPGDLCDTEDDFGDPVAADAFGHPRPHGPISDNSIPAPSILKFDPEGNLLDAWGGPEHHGSEWGWPVDLWSNADGVNCEWPANEHGLHVDADMNVYIAGNGFGDGTLSAAQNDNGWDGQVLKFDPETRKCLLMVGGPQPAGTPNLVDNQDTTGGVNNTPQLHRPANMHATTDELIIDDGYGNCRVVVVDKTDGQFKRGWGAYGKPLGQVECLTEGYAESGDRAVVLGEEAGDLPQQFRRPVHCGRPSVDGFVYVCDRVNNRIQVFMEDGTFVQEKFLRKDTLSNGSVWDLAFSSDQDQSCLHNVDGSNMSLDTLFRDTLELLASEGGAGRNAGEFHWVHDIAVDGQGNAYTTEVDTGKRVQKFDRIGRRGCKSN